MSPDFSHIYVEKGVADFPRTRKILSRFPGSRIIEVNHYKDIFCRKNQDFRLQKQAPKLILAGKKPPYVYRGSRMCEDFGNRYFYYASSIMNCLRDCEYCYLQGMYPSANVVLYVNLEDVFGEVARILERHPVYLCNSYDSDLLAFEKVTSFVDSWLEFAAGKHGLLVETRTKSVNITPFLKRAPLANVIAAWTLSPDCVVGLHERRTPSLKARLKSIRKMLEAGWKVRVCFDPVLMVENWKAEYRRCVHATFRALPPERIHDVSIGVFRMGKDYLKRIRRAHPDSRLLSYPFELDEYRFTYPGKLRKEMMETVRREVAQYVPEEKIFCERGPE